jgi:hypothetical protein
MDGKGSSIFDNVHVNVYLMKSQSSEHIIKCFKKIRYLDVHERHLQIKFNDVLNSVEKLQVRLGNPKEFEGNRGDKVVSFNNS